MAVTRLNSGSSFTSLSKYDSFLAGNTAYQPPNDYESIATVTVGAGGAATINFTSIPSTYQHLQVRGLLRSNIAATGGEYVTGKINNDSGTNYSYQYFGGNGTVAYSGGGGSLANLNASQTALCANDLSNTFAINIWDFWDYSNTNKYKTVKILAGYNASSIGTAGQKTASWRSTSAINSLSFAPGSGTAWVQYSTLALYGIKG